MQAEAAIWKSFGWEAIDCFLRPQGVLLDLVCPGKTDAFFLLASLYRTFGLDGCFCAVGKGHFFFLENVAAPTLGLEFHVGFPKGPDGVMDALTKTLAAREPIILPASARSVLHDESHYYLVLGEEGGKLIFLDSAEHAPYEETTTCRRYRMTRDELEALVAGYSDGGEGQGLYPPLHESGTWTLRIRPGSEAGPALPLLSVLGDALRGTSFPGHASIDHRHLQCLQNEQHSSRDLKARLLRLYLKEANLSQLHLSLLARVFTHEGTHARSGLVRGLHDRLERIRIRRGSVMVDYLTRPLAINWPLVEESFEHDWAMTHRHLASMPGNG